MKIGIVGATGFIGRHLYNYFKEQAIALLGTYHRRRQDDCVQFDLLKDGFSIFKGCSCVIIAGAMTRIDDCFQNQKESYLLNVEKTTLLIKYLSEQKIMPIFFSSDQVFDGSRGNYREVDNVNPVNEYGRQKAVVEESIKKTCARYLIFRLGKVYARELLEASMFSEVTTKLSKGQVVQAATDKIFNPTEINFVCRAVHLCIKKNISGLFHLAEPAIMSSYDFARSIALEYHYPPELIVAVTFDRYNTVEKRALNSSLNVEKLYNTLGPELYP